MSLLNYFKYKLKPVFKWGGRLFLLFFLSINIVGFLAMKIDKDRAIHRKYRIPEKTLFQVAYAGGATGIGTGMVYYWHKVRKPEFMLKIPLLISIQWIILFIFIKLFNRD